MLEANGIAAFVGKYDVTPYLQRSLEALSHRAWKGYALVTEEGVTRFDNPKDIPHGIKRAIGLCLARDYTSKNDLAIHGHVFEKIDFNQTDIFRKMVDAEGEFAFVGLEDESVIFIRDRLGVKPLYYGIEENVTGVASERKALNEIGFPHVETVAPGSVYKASFSEYRLAPAPQFDTDTLEVDFEEASAEVRRLLVQSITRRVEGMRRVAVSFSGGLDSSILAVVASKLTEVELITAAVPNSSDHVGASRAASTLGMPLHTAELQEEEASNQLRRIQRLIESESRMDLAIAMALHFTARLASKLECDILLLGQLADELFGGYAKYVQLYKDRGEKSVKDAMSNDVELAYQLNFERDDKATSPFMMNSLPYSSLPLVKYVLRLPLRFKIDPEKGTRKILLRNVAETLSVPSQIVQKPKKAIQYSSGAQKLVNRLLH